jgi:peptide/nickel transport system permease protein
MRRSTDVLRALTRRLVTAALTLVVVSFAVYGLVRAGIGDPADLIDDTAAVRVDDAQRSEIVATFHLDRPVALGYLSWLGGVMRGDLGRSFRDRRPVSDRIGEAAGISILLNGLALTVMIAVAVPIGALAAARPGSATDRWITGTTFALHAVPVFWTALILQLVFAAGLGWLPLDRAASAGAEALSAPVRALDVLRHLVLPTIALASGGIAFVARFVRTNLLENSSPNAVRAARARGLSARAVLVRHGFRQSAVPLLTLAGLLLPRLLGGSVLVENVFSIPGLGSLLAGAVLGRDLPLVLGLTLLAGAATLAGIALADAAYAFADPRTRRARA